MDSHRPLFQTLPMLVVYNIVEYLEGRSRASFSLDINAHNKGKAVLTPLLSVSERWCAAALYSICDNCLVTFDYASKEIYVSFPAWPPSAQYSQYRKTHLVRRVVVSAALWNDMCDGIFCNTIAKPQYETLSFPSANTLVVSLTKPVVKVNDYTYRPVQRTTIRARTNGWLGLQRASHRSPQLLKLVLVTNKEKVTDFARSLVRLTPAVVSTIISVQSINNSEPNSNHLYDTLISELCRGRAKGLQTHSELNGSLIAFNFTGVSGLTSITHGSGMACMPLVRLANLNAGTLKDLNIGISLESDWLALLYYDGTATPAIFSFLKKLSLTISDAPYTTTWAAIKGIEPFPALTTLDINGGYPFDDNLLYRDNGETLQNLRIPFSAIARNILGRFGILRRKGVTRMASIHIGRVSSADKAFIASLSESPVKQQMDHILETATALNLKSDRVAVAMYSAIYTAPSTSVIRCLFLGGLLLDTSHIIALISALPSLVGLTCEIRGSCSSVGAIPANERPSELDKEYHPLSSNFRVLCVPYSTKSSAESIAIVAMQIAILCPNFLYVDIAPKLRNSFSREVAWAGFNHVFEPYTDILRRLVYQE